MMSTKRIWLVLVFVAGLGLSLAHGESVLKRVTAVEDPELGEMLRIALENMPQVQKLKEYEKLSNSGPKEQILKFRAKVADARVELEQAKVDTARVVTEIYSQVVLLDEQIDTTMRMYKKADIGAKGELATELLLAIAELKADRATALAKLRAAMNIVPKFAFSTKPLNMLNSRLKLCLINDSIYAYEYSWPFGKYDSKSKVRLLGKKTRAEIYELLRQLASDEKLLPIRIDISSTADASGNLGELRAAIVDVLEDAKVQIDAEVRIDGFLHKRYTTEYEIIENKILTGQNVRETYRENGRNRQKWVPEKITTDEFVGKAIGLADRPWGLPRQYFLSYDEQSKDLAEKTKKAVMDAAKEKGVEELITVTLKELEKEGDQEK